MYNVIEGGSKMNICNELKRTIVKEQPQNSISIYEILQILKSINSEQEKLRDNYCDYVNTFFRDYFINKKFKIVFCGFDYDNNELYITVINSNNEYEKYYFSKRNNKFIITEEKNALHKKEILLIKDEFIELYDSYCDLKKIRKQNKDVPICSSNLKVHINLNMLEIYLEELISLTITTYTNEYYINSSKEIAEFINNNYLEILNNLYVDINYCPEWIYDKFLKQKSLSKQLLNK